MLGFVRQQGSQEKFKRSAKVNINPKKVIKDKSKAQQYQNLAKFKAYSHICEK